MKMASSMSLISKTWFVMARFHDRQIRHTIGTYPVVSLAEAREAARCILRDMQLGTYGLQQVPGKPITLSQVMHDFIELHAKQKNRGWKAQQATLRKFAPLDAEE